MESVPATAGPPILGPVFVVVGFFYDSQSEGQRKSEKGGGVAIHTGVQSCIIPGCADCGVSFFAFRLGQGEPTYPPTLLPPELKSSSVSVNAHAN